MEGAMTPSRHALAAIDTLEVGGAQYHLLALARGLAGHGYRTTVVTTAGPLRKEFEAAGIAVIETAKRPIGRRASTGLLSTLLRLARSGNADLLHAHLHGASIAGSLASAASGVPLIVTQHSVGTWQSARDREDQRRTWRSATRVIAVSRQIQHCVERAGATPYRIPNGVDVRSQSESRAADRAFRSRHGVPEDVYVVGFAGRLVEDKDPVLFLETAALVARSCPHARFVVVGDGPLRHVLMERARRLGLDRRLTITGLLPRTSAPAGRFDVLALTSRSEGSPLIVLEAMAAGVPVVATQVGDVPYQVCHGATGFVARSRDPAELAALTLRLADSGVRERFGHNGRDHVAQHFAIEGMVARTARVYQESISRREDRMVEAC
jgi:glycosyltransferase involved in cell wall biosynthesis